MEDEQVHNQIEQLVAEEQELYERGAQGGLNDSEHRRLESIKVGLDQAWDFFVSVARSVRRATTQTPRDSATRRSSSATNSKERFGCVRR